MLGHRKLEVADYLFILKRRKWLILIPLILGPLLALAFSYTVKPLFLSQTLVLIDQQKVPDEYVKPVIATDLDSRLSSMKEQILSRSRIQPIIERYNLYGSSKMSLDDKIDMARKNISIKAIRSEITHAGGLPGFFISFTANDARTAQLVCGEITTLFVNENLRSREASTEGTTDFLKGQLDDAKRTLDDQDAKLAAFQRQYVGKLPGEESPNVNMLTSLNTQLEAATQALSRMEQDKSYQESMLTQLAGSSSTTGPAIVPMIPNPQKEAKEVELQGLVNGETEMLSHYTADYPDVVVLHRRIADMRRQVATMPAQVPAGSPGTASTVKVDNTAINQLRAQMRASEIGIQGKRKEQADLQGQVHMYQERISSSPLVEQQYKELTRDYDTAKKFYDDLLTKMNHSKMATALETQMQGEQFRVMDQPNLPESPISPKRSVFVGGGLAAGLLLGLLISAFLEYRDTALRTERDVWAFTRLPTLAVITIGDEGGAGSLSKREDPDKPGRRWGRKPKEVTVGANS